MYGGRRSRGAGHCVTYKFLGECDKPNCTFRHEQILRHTCREYVPIPEGWSAGMIIGSGGCNVKQLRSIAQCCVKVESEKKRVVVATERQENLQSIVAKLKLILSQEPISGPSWCYIHPRGVSSHNLYRFRPYKGRVPPRAQAAGLTMYELYGYIQQGGTGGETELVERLAALKPFTEADTSDKLRSSLQKVDGDIPVGAEGTRWKQRTQDKLSAKDNIKASLTDTLKVLCEKKRVKSFITRLEARFGRVTWGRFPEGVYSEHYDIDGLADLLFSEGSKHMNIFNTDVKAASVQHIRPDKSQQACSMETFDVKATSIGVRGGDETRLDVRLLVKKHDNGDTSLKVMMVKKNEIKDVTYDTLNLHRQHDIRIGLNHYEYVQDGDPLYAIVREMMGRIVFLPRNKVRIQPKTERWNVHLIRHKKKIAYLLEESYAITISDVSEHLFDVKKGEGVEFDMRMEANNTHVEVELHNLDWECVFGHDAGISADQSLALHFKPGTVDPSVFDTVPHPWQPELIIQDFDVFWGHLETLNDRLDGLK